MRGWGWAGVESTISRDGTELLYIEVCIKYNDNRSEYNECTQDYYLLT